MTLIPDVQHLGHKVEHLYIKKIKFFFYNNEIILKSVIKGIPKYSKIQILKLN